jgi:hypothetical protein
MIDVEPKLTPISKSKKAQAHFLNALFYIRSPAFEAVTQTVLLVLQWIQAVVVLITQPATLVVPAVPILSPFAAVLIVTNPLAPPARPSANPSKASQRKLAPAPAFDEVLCASTSISRSRRSKDAYRKGLDGRQAAWAATRCHGH